MISWEISFADQAEADLRGIYEYIALTLLEPGNAAKMTRRIIKQISKLDNMPKSYAIYPKEPWKSRGLRQVNAGNYAIFFVPVESKHTVVIIRIVYGGRDIDRVLEETSDIEE